MNSKKLTGQSVETLSKLTDRPPIEQGTESPNINK